MWARIKGKTENDLFKLGFKGEYNFRPALMTPMPGQKSISLLQKAVLQLFRVFMYSSTLSLRQVGNAMVNVVVKGHPRYILEVNDIRTLAVE